MSRKFFAGFVLFAAMFSAPVPKAGASGIPVVDVANISQQVIQYAQMLADYAEQINQAVTLGNQYSQMIDAYTQTLREYQHYLRQIEGLANRISAGEWNALLQQTLEYYGYGNSSLIPSLRVENPNFSSDLDAVLSRVHHVPRPVDQVNSDYQSLTGSELSDRLKARLERNVEAYERYKDLQAMVAKNAEDSGDRKTIINEFATDLRGLGAESDLATLQFMATQNQFVFDQNERQIQVLNQILMQQGLQAADEAARKAAMIDREIERLQQATATSSPLYGQNRWGDL